MNCDGLFKRRSSLLVCFTVLVAWGWLAPQQAAAQFGNGYKGWTSLRTAKYQYGYRETLKVIIINESKRSLGFTLRYNNELGRRTTVPIPKIPARSVYATPYRVIRVSGRFTTQSGLDLPTEMVRYRVIDFSRTKQPQRNEVAVFTINDKTYDLAIINEEKRRKTEQRQDKRRILLDLRLEPRKLSTESLGHLFRLRKRVAEWALPYPTRGANGRVRIGSDAERTFSVKLDKDSDKKPAKKTDEIADEEG
jgi:hypothetical protein